MFSIKKFKISFPKQSSCYFYIFILVAMSIGFKFIRQPEFLSEVERLYYWTEIEKQDAFYLLFDLLQVIALTLTAIFIAVQAWATKSQSSATRRLTNETMLPRVQVGLKLRQKQQNPITMVSIHNLSGFPIWIWLDIDLFKDTNFKEDKKLRQSLGYSKFPIPSNQAYEFPLAEIDKIIDKYGMVYARIQYRCNINSYIPEKDVKPTELIYYYSVEKKEWIVYGPGMKFTPLYENLVKD